MRPAFASARSGETIAARRPPRRPVPPSRPPSGGHAAPPRGIWDASRPRDGRIPGVGAGLWCGQVTHTMRVSVGVGWFQAVATSRGGMGRVSIVRSTVGIVRGERDGVAGAQGRRLDKASGPRPAAVMVFALRRRASWTAICPAFPVTSSSNPRRRTIEKYGGIVLAHVEKGRSEYRPQLRSAGRHPGGRSSRIVTCRCQVRMTRGVLTLSPGLLSSKLSEAPVCVRYFEHAALEPRPIRRGPCTSQTVQARQLRMSFPRPRWQFARLCRNVSHPHVRRRARPLGRHCAVRTVHSLNHPRTHTAPPIAPHTTSAPHPHPTVRGEP